MIRDFTLESIDLKLSDELLTFGTVENLQLKNVVVNGKPFHLPDPIRRNEG